MGKNQKFCKASPAPCQDDAELVALGRQFDAALADFLSLQARETDSVAPIEGLLAHMEPIERAIMTVPAASIVGLAIKARVAAHIVSNYWDVPLDRLDLDAHVFRILIEAVCRVAGVSLPFPSDAGAALAAVENFSDCGRDGA
jgi:hypothetical protein